MHPTTTATPRRGVPGSRGWATTLALLLLLTLAPAATADQRFQIVNGTPAPQGAYPWMAGSLFGDELCGASVIAEQWLLTAAHCLVSDRGDVTDVEVTEFRIDTPSPLPGRAGAPRPIPCSTPSSTCSMAT